MNNTLIRELERICEKREDSPHTNSVYFDVSGIIVRYSDHMSVNSKHDVGIYDNGNRTFIVVPMNAVNNEIQWFSKIADVIDFVKCYARMSRIMLKSPIKTISIGVSPIEGALSRKDMLTPDEWRRGLGTLYGSNYEVDSILDEFYKVKPTKGTARHIRFIVNQSNHPKKSLEKVLAALKKQEEMEDLNV